MNKPKLYVLDTGTMKMDKNYMIAMHNPASVDNPNPPAEFVEFPVYAVLIDHPEGKILLILAVTQKEWVKKVAGRKGFKRCFLRFRMSPVT